MALMVFLQFLNTLIYFLGYVTRPLHFCRRGYIIDFFLWWPCGTLVTPLRKYNTAILDALGEQNEKKSWIGPNSKPHLATVKAMDWLHFKSFVALFNV